MECSDEKCREYREKDSEKIISIGLCMTKLMPKRWLFYICGALFIAVITAGYSGYSRLHAGEIQHKANVQLINKNAAAIEELTKVAQKSAVRQERIDTNLENVEEHLDDIKESLKTMR